MKTKEILLSTINTIQANRSRSFINSISNDLLLRDDIGLDSLDLAELTVRLESIFDIDIFQKGLVSTIGQILEQLPNE